MKIGTKWVLGAVLAVCSVVNVHAAAVAILTGGFYTPDLRNRLIASGQAVTEISSNYTAASLAVYDAVITYGNQSFWNPVELEAYVAAGGTLVQTPWVYLNYQPTPASSVFTSPNGAIFNQASPGIAVLDAADELLAGVALPVTPGAFNAGRIAGLDFLGGAETVATWNDGSALLARKSLGLGDVVGINLHVITSDTAFTVINQPWATQLFVNAVNLGDAQDVPEPSALALVGLALLGLAATRRKAGTPAGTTTAA